jgi:cell division septation protein DedD
MSAVITVVLVVGGLLVLLIVLSRSASRRKEEAKADLEREKAELQTPDIFELIRQEAAETGVEEIPGADGVELTIRLRVWHRDEEVREMSPGPAELRFELAPDVDPETATENDLVLTFDGAPEGESAADAEADAAPEDEPPAEETVE